MSINGGLPITRRPKRRWARSAAGFMTENSRKRSSSAGSVATVVCAGESEDSAPAAKKKKSFVAKPIQWP